MRPSVKIVKRLSKWRFPYLSLILIQLVWILVTMLTVSHMAQQSQLPFAYDKLPFTFLLNLPALLFLLFLWYRNTRSSNKIYSNSAFFAIFVMTCFTVFVVTQLMVFNPIIVNNLGENENLRMVAGLTILTNLLQILGFSAFYLYLRSTQMQMRLANAEREKAQFQLRLLKSQLDPHFLFNALNVGASLPYEDAERASQFIKQLGNVYRYLLRTSDLRKVTLEKELDFVRSYIYLQQVRFEEKLQVTIQADPSLMDRQLVPGSVQLLVENAIKHNTHTTENPLQISIYADTVGINVTNNLQPRPATTPLGRGLEYLHQQYAQFDKTIGVVKTDTRFTVRLPFLV